MASLIAPFVKNLPAMQETPVRFLGREDPLEKGKATQLQYLENSMNGIVHGTEFCARAGASSVFMA